VSVVAPTAAAPTTAAAEQAEGLARVELGVEHEAERGLLAPGIAHAGERAQHLLAPAAIGLARDLLERALEDLGPGIDGDPQDLAARRLRQVAPVLGQLDRLGDEPGIAAAPGDGADQLVAGDLDVERVALPGQEAGLGGPGAEGLAEPRRGPGP